MPHDSRTVLTRTARPPDLTVNYGGHPDHVADVWLPAAGGIETWALVLFLHGGFWRQAYDRTHLGPLAEALADAGYVVATPEYRRTGAPGGGWPGTFEDVAAAVATVPGLVDAAVAARPGYVEGARPPGIVLAGHSAGGHLALWAASRLAGVAGVVALAPVADLRAAYALDLDGGAVAALLGGGPDAEPERYLASDPVSLLPLGCRLVLLHGTRDAQVPIELSRRFAGLARGAGDEVELAELTGVDHFDLIDPLSAAWPRVLTAISGVTSADAGCPRR